MGDLLCGVHYFNMLQLSAGRSGPNISLQDTSCPASMPCSIGHRTAHSLWSKSGSLYFSFDVTLQLYCFLIHCKSLTSPVEARREEDYRQA